jgi:hypothetical protein
MLLIQIRQITRFKYENEKVSSDPPYSLQDEALVIFLIYLNFIKTYTLFHSTSNSIQLRTR